MLSPVSRYNVFTELPRKQPTTQMPSVHGRSSSYGTPQPLPILRGCRINQENIPSWSLGTSSILCSICYCSFPILITHLRYFCCYMACQISYKTIKVYLAGICLEHLERGFADPTKDELLHLLCTGIKRSQGISTHTRLPITISVLQTLKSRLHFDSSFSPLEKRLLWAAFTMALYEFLRASEFATPSLT